ncbi:MAG: glycine cleavage system aminomethyltransferase GcvT [Nitrospinae bacterium]|nr:glycine cleavage system aminomethyltransferase GcvT [Nitrospinota bacterium]
MTKKTVLYDRHVSAGAKIVDFAGWMMPVQYAGVLAEHATVRNNAGVFDVSHMGEVFVTGPEAPAFVDNLVTNDTRGMSDGNILYTVMCDNAGFVIDDLLVYKIGPQKFLLVVNASNTEKDFKWMLSQKGRFNVEVADRSPDLGMLAVQGPKAVAIASKIIAIPKNLKYYNFFTVMRDGNELIVSRTGYTGEDGVEIIAKNDDIVKLWDALFEAGKSEGIAPAGLAARDLLRIEAGYSLYGHELDEKTDPLSAGLSWVVKMEGREFVGKAVLKNFGRDNKRICFAMEGKAVPRQGYKLLTNGKESGFVTSGTFSPVLQKPFGIGYILGEGGNAPLDGSLTVEIRGREIPAKIVKPPVRLRVGG